MCDIEHINGVPTTKVIQLEGPVVVSVPPPGKSQVINVFIDPETQIVTIEYNDVPM
jgi:hypothetical protein